MSLREALTYLDGLGFDHLYRRSMPPEPAAQDSASSESEPAAQATEAGAGSLSIPEDPRSLFPPAEPEAALSPEVRLQRLDEVRRLSQGCRVCGLCERRQNVVFGSGNPDADLMFVGEGPGAEEDRQGLPFVGAAGELLTKIIGAIDLRRDQVYIANMVKCRPPNNRDPQPDEIAACRPYLDHQIDLVKPKVIVALGRVAAQALLQSNLSLGRLRGTWHEYRGSEVRATYHPAALLRYEKYKRPTWEDMKVVRDRIAAVRG
ncbi:MAG: uracil-DNA glycosylase [Thermoanaerobaculia bacterium]|nr:uracil-DNA glycosylase [Thermoanaerobaculia bacterium]